MSNAAATTITTLPNLIHALVWTSAYAGDVPGDSIIGVSSDPSDPQLTKRVGEETYDGTSMRSRGRYEIRTIKKPKYLATIERKFGDSFQGRVIVGPCQSGCDFGVWIDGKPVSRIDIDGDWDWSVGEFEYLMALCMLRGEYSPRDLEF